MTIINKISSPNYNPTSPVEQEQAQKEPEFQFDFALHETTGDIHVNMGQGGYFNGWNGYVMTSPGYSFVQANLFLTKEQAEKKWKLTLSHLIMWQGDSQTSVSINGATIANYHLCSETLKDDSFSIDLHEGYNSIQIDLLADGYMLDCTLPRHVAPYGLRKISLAPEQ